MRIRPVHRGWAGLCVVVLLLLAGCSPSADSSARAPVRAPGCGPLTHAEVLGTPPTLGAGRMDLFPNAETACQGWWLPRLRQGFVAQGLALDGRTVWVSGWDWSHREHARLCQVMQVDLRSGKLLRFTGIIRGRVGGRTPTFCRHGGGITVDRHGIWLAEASRLWLLDPDRIGRSGQVLRVWRVAPPIRGSVSLSRAGRLGLGSWHLNRPGRLDWFDPAALLAPGVIDLVPRGSGPTRVTPVQTRPIAERIQGLMVTRKGRWLVRSTSRCGVLKLPGGPTVGVAPGSEDLELDGHGGLWVVSESASEPYQRKGGRPVVPVLLRYDLGRLRAGLGTSCDDGW